MCRVLYIAALLAISGCSSGPSRDEVISDYNCKQAMKKPDRGGYGSYEDCRAHEAYINAMLGAAAAAQVAAQRPVVSYPAPISCSSVALGGGMVSTNCQ